MYRPTMYDKSDTSFKSFCNKINKGLKDIIIKANDTETYDNDGQIYLRSNGRCILGVDQEYRDRYFSHGILPYKDVHELGRKMTKESIDLFIQSDVECENVLLSFKKTFRDPVILKAYSDKGKVPTLFYNSNDYNIFQQSDAEKIEHYIFSNTDKQRSENGN